jgi:RimJ/RimL family protein N-acetyltransferase
MVLNLKFMRFWPQPCTRESTAAWIDRWIRAYAEDGCGYWLARDRHSGEAIGQAGVLLQDLGGPEREAGLGYIIHKPYWRQGYAFEAAAACLDWAVRALEARRVIATVRPENLPSAAVARKLGMTPERDIDYRGFVHTVFATARMD